MYKPEIVVCGPQAVWDETSLRTRQVRSLESDPGGKPCLEQCSGFQVKLKPHAAYAMKRVS